MIDRSNSILANSVASVTCTLEMPGTDDRFVSIVFVHAEHVMPNIRSEMVSIFDAGIGTVSKPMSLIS